MTSFFIDEQRTKENKLLFSQGANDLPVEYKLLIINKKT